jgi:hypothetical protein
MKRRTCLIAVVLMLLLAACARSEPVTEVPGLPPGGETSPPANVLRYCDALEAFYRTVTEGAPDKETRKRFDALSDATFALTVDDMMWIATNIGYGENCNL